MVITYELYIYNPNNIFMIRSSHDASDRQFRYIHALWLYFYNIITIREIRVVCPKVDSYKVKFY